MNTDCPNELLALDQNAANFWPKLLKRAQVTIDRETNTILRDQRGSILIGICLPDLLSRLECQRQRENGGPQDELARAGIWFHVAEACAPGDYIPELTVENRYILNPWIVTPALKYPNPRFAMLRHQSTARVDEPPKPRRQRASQIAKQLVWAVPTPISAPLESVA